MTSNSSANSSANNTFSGEPSKISGQYHSMKGSATETIGQVMGSASWQQSGKEEHAAGEAEYNAARAKGYAEGVTDEFGGKKDSIIGAVTGDRSQQTSGNARQDKGQAERKINS